jgi:hypothetical protein
MRVALVIIVLLAFLAGAVFVAHYGWVSAGDVVMPAWGWLMLGLGVFFTILVGGGLMALVFYSSRAGFDEPPEIVQEKKHGAAKWAKMIPRRKKRRAS